jgi:sulfur-oxidizing protein SoxY
LNVYSKGSQIRESAMTGGMELTRRSVVCGGLAISLMPALERPAHATPAGMANAIRELTGGATVKPGRVKLVLPELAENGNIVSLAVTVQSPMTEADRVTSVHIFSELNPITTLVRFHVSPRAGPNPTLLTNIRLADSQRVTAIAALSDGSFWSGEASVVVTIAACIDGG